MVNKFAETVKNANQIVTSNCFLGGAVAKVFGITNFWCCRKKTL